MGRYQRDLVCELYHLFSGQSPLFYKGCDFQSVFNTLLTGKFTALNSNNRICLNYWAIISALKFFLFWCKSKDLFKRFHRFYQTFHEWQCILSSSPFLTIRGHLGVYTPGCIILG